MWGQSPDSLPFKRIFEPIAALARRRVGLRPVSATCKALLRMVPALLTFLSCCGHAAAQQQESYYEVEQIASETLDAPEAFDLSNPRATMRSFSDAAARADFELAARALVPSDQTDVPRATLARMLHEVIDRQLWIDPGSLSDRPDALVEAVGDNPRAGQARRSLPLGTVEMDRYPVTIRLNRYKSNDNPPFGFFRKTRSTPYLRFMNCTVRDGLKSSFRTGGLRAPRSPSVVGKSRPCRCWSSARVSSPGPFRL